MQDRERVFNCVGFMSLGDNFLLNMKKRAKKRQNEKLKKDTKHQPEELPKGSSPDTSTTDDTPFDFGGLPSRDLKKNLGCG